LPRSKRHYRITLGDILSAHEEALTHGGSPGINSLALTQSAIERPYCGYCPHTAQKSAALLQSVATNHAFTDGNEGTALILVNLLLNKTGYELLTNQGPNKSLEDAILAAVEGQLDFEGLVQWFEARLRRRTN
jgi:death-on-curing protein